MSLEDIAAERGLTTGTIESHLAHAVGANRLSIYKFMREEDVDYISNAVKEMEEGFTSKDLYSKLEGKFGYNQLRAVMNHCRMGDMLNVEDKSFGKTKFV